MKEIKVKQKIMKSILYILLSLFMTAISLFLLLFVNDLSIAVLICAVFGAIFFTLSVLANIFMLFARNTKLLINENGFINSTTIFTTGFIPWSEVEEIDLISLYEGPITVRVSSAYVENISKLKRRAFIKKSTTTNISLLLALANYEEIYEVMKKHFEKHTK